MKRDLQEIIDVIAMNASNKKYRYFYRKPMLRKIDNNVAGALGAFSRRMAVWGARQFSADLLVRGCIALILEAGREDIRDTMAVMPLLYHSATKINADPGKIFNDAAAYYRSVVSDALLDFLKRTPRDRSLEAWGVEEVNGPEGIYYR
jgi:hypothetical protein